MTADVHGLPSPTEQRNPHTLDIDVLPTLELLRRINAEDAGVHVAVAQALPELATLVDATEPRFRSGGNVHYFGAGTSGRLAALDAAELVPTYSLESGRVVAHLAGGAAALSQPVENAEDDVKAAAIDAADVGAADVAIGVAASGQTPYVKAALTTARAAGAYTALVSSNPHAPLATAVDCHVCAPTGAEVIAGSTRMKAGTATKLLLNSFSTALMVRLGKTYSNLMIDVANSNAKLRTRMVSILAEATGLSTQRCEDALANTGGEMRTALVCLLADVGPAEARTALEAGSGDIRRVIHDMTPST